MFKRNFLSLIAAFLLIAVLSACASGASTPAAAPEVNQPAAESSYPAATEPAQPAAPEATQPAPAEPAQAPTVLSDAEMEALIQQKLQGSPHTLTFVLEESRTAEEWSEILDRMIGYGAKINPEEKQLIIDWLVSH